MTKDDRQKIGITKWIKANGVGTFNYVMRFGKTITALKIAQKVDIQFPKAITLVIVPSLAIKEVWKTAISKFEYKFNTNVAVRTIEEVLRADVVITVKCLIIDELHKFVSGRRLKIVNGTIIKARYKIGLTGTYPYDNATINKYYPIIDTITEQEALNNNWISKFLEYNIPLELTNADKANYVKYSTIMQEISSTFIGLNNVLSNPDKTPFFTSTLDLILSCYKGKNITGHKYVESRYIREAIAVKMGWTPTLNLNDEYDKQVEEYWNPEAIKTRVTNYYKAMRARNDIHNINEVKLNAVLELYKLYKNDVIITFSESTIFADMLTDAINNTYDITKAVSYHSNIESKALINFIDDNYFTTKGNKIKKFGSARQLKYIISMIKLKVFNCINTVKALDEGLNVDDINIVITTSGTSNPMQYSQRSARGKTIDNYNKNKVTLIFNLYFDNFMYLHDGIYKEFKSRDKIKLMQRTVDRNINEFKLKEYIENACYVE